MADFNPAIMIDVTRPATTLNAVFTGSIAASTGILSVTSYQSGQITSQMTLTTSGYDAVVVTDQLAPEEGEIERWQTHRIYAGVYGSVTNSVLTVASVWRGSMATLPGTKYLFLTAQPAGSRVLAPISVDGNGLGTYSVSVVQGLNVSPRRMIVQYYNTASQAISNATFSGVWDWEAVSSFLPTTDQSAGIQHLALAAKSSARGLYFPPGRYRDIIATGCPLYGKSAFGSDASRTVLYRAPVGGVVNLDCDLEDLRLEYALPGTLTRAKRCDFYFPSKRAMFTGTLTLEGSVRTLTVSSITEGMLHVGSDIVGPGVTKCKIIAMLTGTGGTGTYQVDGSQNLPVGPVKMTGWLNVNYFISAIKDCEVTDNVLDIPGWYVPIRMVGPTSAIVKRNHSKDRRGLGEFHSHVIKFEPGSVSPAFVEITHNRVDMPHTTGIFLGSNRLTPIRNITIEHNELHGNTEECIAVDGFGNNAGLSPVICNGRLTAVANDGAGRLVVTLGQMVHNSGGVQKTTVSTRVWSVAGYITDDVLTLTGTLTNHLQFVGATLKGTGVGRDVRVVGLISGAAGAAGATYRLSRSNTLGSAGSPVSDLTFSDWRKFYFIFSEGTGTDGTITEIVDYDTTNNTLTLNMYYPAHRINTGFNTWAGVHAGFFTGSVRHNRISGNARHGQNDRQTLLIGSISGTTLTVYERLGDLPNLYVGDMISGVSITAAGDYVSGAGVASGTRIVSLLSGSLVDGPATFQVSVSQEVDLTYMTAARTITASIDGTTMTVTGTTTGSGWVPEDHGPIPGTRLYGGGVQDGTYVVRQLSGATGNVGTYEVSVSQSLSSSVLSYDLTGYATGISLYQNVFHFDVAYNEVSGVAHGIFGAGGYALGTYHTLAYHNSIHDNTVACVKQGLGAIGIWSAERLTSPTGGIAQRGNKIYNNVCINGNITLSGVEDQICENNVLKDNRKINRLYAKPVLPATDL